MCIPGAGILNAALNIGVKAYDVAKESKNVKYRTQIAIKNAKNAQNEALRQKQLGIEESRKEKQTGIKESSKLRAAGAASGFDVDSATSDMNYNDVILNANINSESVTNAYDAKAQAYFEQAFGYLNDAKQYQKSYKSNLFDTAANSLSKMYKVDNSWYSTL